ncbi:hypothetical protein BDY21DRAFT_368117 [Lineolata rhizophorae]|uniref:Uncharacterized protein n=1 Tax=Lineolata rhizophorae TaxID=578093 RepID=A0A6A6PDS9_9PEZI|nr:hypothetical protein BDY21DRAFT_368117 [Lineolata rhizophorae]
MPPAPTTPQQTSGTHRRTSSSPTKRDSDATPTAASLKALDPGATVNASVRDKVRQWQTQGGGVLEGAEAHEDEDAAVVGDARPCPALPGGGANSKEESSASLPGGGGGAGKADRAEANGDEKVKKVAPSPTVRRKDQQQQKHTELDPEWRTAPKKRVVSDEHWRKIRSQQKQEATAAGAWVRPPLLPHRPKPKDSSPEKDGGVKIGIAAVTGGGRRKSVTVKVDEQGDVVKRKGSPGYRDDEDEDAVKTPSPPQKRASARRERRKSRDPASSSHELLLEDDAPSKRRRSRREDDILKSPKLEKASSDKSADEETPQKRRSTRRTGKDESPGVEVDASPKVPASSERQRSRRKARQVDENAEGGASPELQPEQQPRVYSNRVESWLSSTPDPFAEPSEASIKSSRSSKRGSRKHRASLEDLEEDTKDANVAEERTEGSGLTGLSGLSEKRRSARRHRQARSSEGALDPSPRGEQEQLDKSAKDLNDLLSLSEKHLNSAKHSRLRSWDVSFEKPSPEDDTVKKLKETLESPKSPNTPDADSTSPSASMLKRRGARRRASPEKGRVRAKSMHEPERPQFNDEATSTALSSSVDPISAAESDLKENAQGGYFHLRRQFPSTGKRLSTIASVETFNTQAQEAAPAISEAPEEAIEPPVEETPKPEKQNELVVAPAPSDTQDTASEVTVKGRSRSIKQRKMATHEDLMSVLSMPNPGTRSVVSMRSIRTNRSRLATASIADIMKELASDETKYMRELRTLVDGVIPVLLTCVLSKSDAAIAAGLFTKSANAKSDPNATKPIIDMGIALERLKSTHRSIPKDDPDMLLNWAQRTQKVYADYIKAWRLGFQDVVVNLAPADGSLKNTSKNVGSSKNPSWADDGMPRNEEGYVINSDGERVDVAFLLKRPLVRLKYLAKTLKGINAIKPSEAAEKQAISYQNLVADARKRSNEERARLEDEAAAAIDPTRARDPRTLAPLSGVTIDASRCVRARDYFDMHLVHSNGEEMDCRIEILLRDDAPGRGNSGDILVCQVDDTGRWLFFPPIQLGRVSARAGEEPNELVIMIRGYRSGGQEWREVFAARCEDEHAVGEWLQMVGTTPVPPALSSIERPSKSVVESLHLPAVSEVSTSLSTTSTSAGNLNAPTTPLKSRSPSPREVEIPFGEQAQSNSRRWSADNTPDRTPVKGNSPEEATSTTPATPQTPTQEPPRFKKMPTQSRPLSSSLTEASRSEAKEDNMRSLETPLEQLQKSDNARAPEDERAPSNGSPTSLKRTRAKRLSKFSQSASQSLKHEFTSQENEDIKPEMVEKAEPPCKNKDASNDASSASASSSRTHTPKRGYQVWFPPSEAENGSDEEDNISKPASKLKAELRADAAHNRTSSVPGYELPGMPKLRKSSPPSTPVRTAPKPTRYREAGTRKGGDCRDEPASAPAKLQKKMPEEFQKPRENMSRVKDPEKSPEPVKSKLELESRQALLSPSDNKVSRPPPSEEKGTNLATSQDKPPPPPPHRSSPIQTKTPSTPQFTPSLPGYKVRRRSSSPLKHEYEPSTATESSPSEESYSEEDTSTMTESSIDDLEADDVPTPLVSIPYNNNKHTKASPPESMYSIPNDTLSPSQSASQSPYRTVPQQQGQAGKAIATISCWRQGPDWESLHPDLCSIVVSGGLVEAFELDAQHSQQDNPNDDDMSSSHPNDKPIIACELTPNVLVRRAAALDIFIRSPPTARSKVRPASSNIMFRCRSIQEQGMLFDMILWARKNNATFNALEAARQTSNNDNSWAAAMDRQNAARPNTSYSGGRSFFGMNMSTRSSILGPFRTRSYRAKLRRPMSTSAGTENTAGTMNSALSAIRRFGGGSKGIFNLAKSTIQSRDGANSTGSFGGSSDNSGSGGSGTFAEGMPGCIFTTDMRLHLRGPNGNWVDLGRGRLNILPASSPSSRPVSQPASTPTSPPGSADGRDGTTTPPAAPAGNPAPSRGPNSPRADGTEKRVVVLDKTRRGVRLDVTLGETCFERNSRTGIAINVKSEEQQVGAVGGVSGTTTKVYMLQMKSDRECAYAFSLLGKLRY